jgi:hypothetical protein
MKGETRERWKELCELIADEQDPGRMMELVKELNRILAEKEQRLLNARSLQPDAE